LTDVVEPGRDGLVGADDDVARLRRCVVFGPGAEFDRLRPSHIESSRHASDGTLRANPDYLLFDDLVLTEALADEHASLRDVIRAAVGDDNLLDLRDLLRRLLWPTAFRERVIAAVVDLEHDLFGVDISASRTRLLELPPSSLADALISGVVPESGQQVLRWPMPNWLFARDCFAVAANAIVVGYPRHRARLRDGLLARAIVRYHPLLAGVDLIDLESGGEEPCFFEGGDLVLPAPSVALIGIGIRTNEAGAQVIAQALADRGYKHVLGVRLPLRRGAMHLDTIFTMIDRDAAIVFPEAFDPRSAAEDRVEVIDLLDGGTSRGCDLVGALGRVGVSLTTIACGDGDPIAAAREQWTDGANAFCLGPGRIVLYARNRVTLRALNRAGYEILTPTEFCRNAELLMAGSRRFVVALTGFELSRGRGGPRCLTLPLARRRN